MKPVIIIAIAGVLLFVPSFVMGEVEVDEIVHLEDTWSSNSIFYTSISSVPESSTNAYHYWSEVSGPQAEWVTPQTHDSGNVAPGEKSKLKWKMNPWKQSNGTYSFTWTRYCEIVPSGEPCGVYTTKYIFTIIDYPNKCLIATATYGTELAPQVQMLREIRDNSLLQTSSGSAFMASFNSIYYTFAPTIAQWENESPIFKEIVRTTITPLIASLSLLQYVNMDTDSEVLFYGISMIVLNLGMYIGIPATVIVGIRKRF